MSDFPNCPFCDSSEKKVREFPISFNWKEALDSISYYFLDFTYTHMKNLCNTCFEYLQHFLDCKKTWLDNERKIQSKRKLGQFRGLKHIKKLKKDSSLVCRLCLNENNPEDVIFIYLDNEFYQPGYIQKMMCLHARDIDVDLTENPVICQECLDVIQTFDALYQMTVENQAGKEKPDLKLKNPFNSTDPNQEVHNEIVHVQLKKVKDNSFVLHSVTEEESAVNALLKNKETSENNIVLNGWTMKKVFDVIQKQKSKDKEKQNNDDEGVHKQESKEKEKQNEDIYVISDEEEMACSTLVDEVIPSNDCDGKKEIEDNSSKLDEKERRIPVIKHKYQCDTSNVENTTDIIEINDSDEEPTKCTKLQSITSCGKAQGQLPYDESQNEPQMNIYVDAEFNDNNIETAIGENSTKNVEVPSDVAASNSTEFQCKGNLQQDLSDFLQFKKSSFENETDCSKTTSDIQTVNNAERMKLSAVLPDGSLSSTDDSESLLTASQKLLQSNHLSTISVPAWKFLRGCVFADSKDDEYCIWFPYNPGMKKHYPSKNFVSNVTVLEDRTGSRLYRCNKCMEIMTEESSVSVHQCHCNKKKTYLCKIKSCNFYTFNKFLFMQHVNAHTLLSAEQIKQFKCRSCDYFSIDNDYLEHHMNVTHKKRTVKGVFFKCGFCFFQSDNPGIIAHHELVRHSDKKSKFSEERFG